jgi:hypothetical protein
MGFFVVGLFNVTTAGEKLMTLAAEVGVGVGVGEAVEEAVAVTVRAGVGVELSVELLSSPPHPEASRMAGSKKANNREGAGLCGRHILLRDLGRRSACFPAAKFTTNIWSSAPHLPSASRYSENCRAAAHSNEWCDSGQVFLHDSSRGH